MAERKREKVTWEVKEYFRRKAQNCHKKDLHKKETHVYNNCYELRSRAINKRTIAKVAQKTTLKCYKNSDKILGAEGELGRVGG